jgi:hypothetical protein
MNELFESSMPFDGIRANGFDKNDTSAVMDREEELCR